MRTLFFLMIGWIIGSTVTFGQKQNEGYRRAEALFEKEEYARAALLYEKALAKFDANNTSPLSQSLIQKYLLSLIRSSQEEKALRTGLAYLSKEQGVPKYHIQILENLKTHDQKIWRNKYMSGCIKQSLSSVSNNYSFASLLVNQGLYKDALQVYQSARSHFGYNRSYTLNIVYLLQRLGEIEEAIDEFLRYIEIQEEDGLSHLLVFLPNIRTAPSYIEKLARRLRIYRERQPDNYNFFELSMWVKKEMQKYKEAFEEAKIYALRNQISEDSFFSLAKETRQKKHFAIALDILSYISTTYPNSSTQRKALYTSLSIRREQLLETSLTREELQKIEQSYQVFIQSSTYDPQEIQARKELAQLYLYYLDQSKDAVSLLKNLLEQQFEERLYMEVKLLLAQAYLFLDQPWEAALLCAQVDKDTHLKDIQEKSRFLLAKVYYYQGSFQLAKRQLNVLRKASSKYIANDALLYSQIISLVQEKDTTCAALRIYAQVELLMERKSWAPAASALEHLQQVPEIEGFSNYLLARIYYKQGHLSTALSHLHALPSSSYLFLDKSLLFKAQILVELGEQNQAIEEYRTLLRDFEGSIYASEARTELKNY